MHIAHLSIPSLHEIIIVVVDYILIYYFHQKGHGPDVKHQNGNGNTKTETLPTIVVSNLPFCGGMGHKIDHLMYPVRLEEMIVAHPDDTHHMNNFNKLGSTSGDLGVSIGGGGGSTGGSYCTWSPDTDW